MANYKRITDVDVLTEASEVTNVLVEENGSLKKVPASSLGGGNGNFLIIRYKMEIAPVSLDSDPVGVYLANMTFAEFDKILLANELAGMYLNIFNQGNGMFELYHGEAIHTDNYPDNVILKFRNDNNGSKFLYFYPDNTITEIMDE